MENFDSVSHFFTNPNQISQSSASAQGFGPVSATQYRISTVFTATNTAKAYAICKGVVLIQSNSNSPNKVNLILKPYKQPISGVNIKYFIYRGLQKSDFFTGNLVNENDTGSSDFIDKIRTDFSEFHATEPNPNPPFLAKYIGFDTTFPGERLIDDFFFKQSQYVESNGEFIEDDEGFGAFELPIINQGASLGYFTPGDCAVDVVLDYGDYKPLGEVGEFKFDLAYARANVAVIELPGTSTYTDKVVKEQIFQFLDVAAYFGSHAPNGKVIIDNNGTKQNLTGADIYTNVLNNFITKNNLYLYIQSDRTRSYNFYNNYNIGQTTNSLKYGLTASSLTDRSYSTQGWPIIIESPSSASIFLQFITDNNVNTVLYGQKGTVVNAAKNNFSNADDLLLPPDENGNLSVLTKVLELTNPVSATNAPIISTFNIIIYQGIAYSYVADETVDENNNPVTVYAQPNFFDDVFDLINAEPIFQSDGTDYSVINSKKLKLINEYYNNKQQGISAVQTLVVKDSIATGDEASPYLKRVAYITETVEMLNNPISLSVKVASNINSTTATNKHTNPQSNYIFQSPYYTSVQLFTDNSVIVGLQLNIIDEGTPSKIALGITQAENIPLKAIINTLNLQNPKLFLQDLHKLKKDFISPEGIKFRKYKLVIVGDNINSVGKIYFPDNDIYIYSLDRRFYFSAAYSQYVTVDEYDFNKLILSVE
ncbi:hypothetical protein GR160_13910 [Flavobacterium sp. Sd200]|uniref:hypothetical protein n=1 Tax=Flavobacterium sp. Sd200 TaxID=2692211 RepID=UPI00136D7385|nr:hypothetical protein [Flavobacterium sp. Sd200]MXN92319.1 hypothetical protein [Flavobacterium sp. Sd200]